MDGGAADASLRRTVELAFLRSSTAAEIWSARGMHGFISCKSVSADICLVDLSDLLICIGSNHPITAGMEDVQPAGRSYCTS